MNERPATGGDHRMWSYGVPLPGYSDEEAEPADAAPAALPHPTQPLDAADPVTAPWLESVEMGDHNHQGDFGEQFVRALATAANLNVSNSRDRLGIDWELTYPGRGGTRRFPQIQAQVKCWSKPKGSGDSWRYPLRVHNYNLLSGRDYYHPRFLFLVVVPEDSDEWVEATHEGLLLRHAAYWACFHDHELTDKSKDDKLTVSVPKANLLTTGTLHGLFGPEFRAKLGVS
ncbi:DUF4365 domain-containing protein [Streptomyces sp. NBC_01794]|uniref:DUF4365 domain-containing protein n=1 Tax=Streptomyces sp. NBC_01794 TaxID=2975942 RepID=UPI00308E23E3|nr:DUF4365 domain-containing protein [Streptomyces sp. NBC_01794]